MARTRRLRHRNSQTNGTGSGSPVIDADELYVREVASAWVLNIAESFQRFDDEALELVAWLVGPDTTALGKVFVKHAPTGDHDEIREFFASSGPAALSFSRTLSHLSASWPRSVWQPLTNDIVKFVEDTVAGNAAARRAPVRRQVASFQRAFGLTELECELFLFLYFADRWSPLEAYFLRHLSCNENEGFSYLAAALGVTRAEVTQTAHGSLENLGLVDFGYGGALSVGDIYQSILRDPLQDMLPNGLYRKVAKEPLPMSAHHLPEGALEHALALVQSDTPQPVHILIHGPAGAGKTTFARRLAHESGRPALEVPPDEKDDVGTRRLGLVACQRLKNEGRGVTVLVDEADHLLETSTSWVLRGARQDKAWLNELLETPGSRVIWVTNSVDGIVSSTMRRFAFSIQFRPMRRRQRIALWDRVLRRRRVKRFFTDKDIHRLARQNRASAGNIDMAVKMAAEIASPTRRSLHAAVARALDAQVQLTTGGMIGPDKEQVVPDYSLDGLNIEGDIDALLGRLESYDRYLRDSGDAPPTSMNVLFHGPPGTGKSELARHIAHRLDRELIVKRASDLLAPFVGQTEMHIAAAFDEAEREDALLVIDEVDTMLFNREAAQHSWEVSFTNELLTQMERFKGILVATTNRLSALDAASMRRFGEKLRFDFLTAEGNEIFYRKLLTPLAASGGRLDDSERQRLRTLSQLTPGDFRIVRDRHAFAGRKSTPNELIAALENEARIKRLHSQDRRVGF